MYCVVWSDGRLVRKPDGSVDLDRMPGFFWQEGLPTIEAALDLARRLVDDSMVDVLISDNDTGDIALNTQAVLDWLDTQQVDHEVMWIEGDPAAAGGQSALSRYEVQPSRAAAEQRARELRRQGAQFVRLRVQDKPLRSC